MMKWLSSSLLLARVYGMEIRLHFSVIFSVFITFVIFRPFDFRGVVLALFWLVGFLLCILLHELGHALAARLVGVDVKNVVIWLLGGWTSLSHRPEKAAHNLIISAAGPLVNMLLAFLFVLAYILVFLFAPRDVDASLFLWIQTFIELFFSLAVVNIILVVFNLLPIYPLDGGNILHAAMDLFFGRSNADFITMLVSIPVLLGLVAFGIFTRDYLLLASCVLIAIGVGTLNRSALHSINLGINYIFKRPGYYYLQGDYERALQYYTVYIDREPQQVSHYLARSACYLNMQQKERALADVERALKIAPNNPVALQLRGEIHVMDKNYAAALDLFDRVQQINPNWSVPYFDRGSVLLDQKEYRSALGEFDKAVALLSHFPLFYVVRSLAYFKIGNMEHAHRDQDQAVRFSEKEALVMADVNMQIYEDYLDWAEDYYARVLAKQPRSWLAYQGRADAYRINHKHKKAIADYTRALEINPREPRLYLGRGKSSLVSGDLIRAASDFRQVSIVTDKLHLRRQADELLRNMNTFHSSEGVKNENSITGN